MDNKSVQFVDEVEHFNKIFGKTNNYVPTIPSQEQCKFVFDTIEEELNEYKEAYENNDIIGVADALGDIMYFLCNGIMLHGLKDKFQDIYTEIQASNLSKSCDTEEEARQSAEFRAKELGVETHYEKSEDKWIIYRTSDRKCLKSLNYKKPLLSKFFE